MPSIVSYNTLLASYASLGAWREALDAITHVLAAQADGVNPNTSEGGPARPRKACIQQ